MPPILLTTKGLLKYFIKKNNLHDIFNNQRFCVWWIPLIVFQLFKSHIVQGHIQKVWLLSIKFRSFNNQAQMWEYGNM